VGKVITFGPSSTVANCISCSHNELGLEVLALALHLWAPSQWTGKGGCAYSAKRMVGPKATPTA
jgi:hypothetical protein